MDNETRAALTAQVEARTAYNALAADAAESAVNAAQAALAAADKALLEALEKASEQTVAPAELRDRISLGRYMNHIVADRAIDGAESELNKELKLSDNVVPLQALEDRADAVSPQNTAGAALPSGTVNQTTAPMLSRVFTQTDSAFLGVSMPMVPAGERVCPVMTDGTVAAMEARGGKPDAAAAKFAVVNATPHRLTGRYVFDLEGVAELGAGLEATLRSDLRMEMGYQMDRQVLLGDGTGANVKGLLTALADTGYPDAEAAQTQLDWANLKELPITYLDGKYARTEAAFRLLVGKSTYQRARAVYRTDASGDSMDAIAELMRLGTTVRQSFQIPAQTAILSGASKRQEHALLAAEPGAAVAPVWQGITLIRDPYTNAGEGQVVLTAHMLFDFILRREDGWKNLVVNPLNTAK